MRPHDSGLPLIAKVVTQIGNQRERLLVHRYLYYVAAFPLIDDYTYDMMERKLRDLVAAHPNEAAAAKYSNECPLTTVGSDMGGNYPLYVARLAQDLSTYVETHSDVSVHE